MSIRLRLVLWQTLLLGLALTGFAAVVYATVGAQEASRLEAELRVAADNVRQAFYDAGSAGHGGERDGPPGGGRDGPPYGKGENDAPPPPAVVNPMIAEALPDPALVAQVIAADGSVLGWSENRPEPLPIPAAALAHLFDGGGQQDASDIDVGGEAFRLYGDPIGGADGPGPPGAVVVAAPLAAMAATMARWRLLLGGAVLGTTGLAAAVGWFLATQAMRPVDRMTRAARAIGDAADFERRLPEPARQDELGRLAATFNRMLGQLGDAFATQKRFLADASHELRTPLTVVRTNTEALLRGAAADPAERDETLRAIARETERMGRLVGDLLALARADAGQPLAHRRCSLDALALEVYHQARSLAVERRLVLDEWEQVEVEGDPDRLKQVLLNLLDNALRHTPAGGTVALDLLRRGDEAVLRVRDTGSGIPPEHLERIFERFYRVDQPRTRQAGAAGASGSGTGLGLAIAKEVAEAHGGRIEVESRVGVGSTFSLVLPVAPPPRPEPTPVRPPVGVGQTLTSP